jgi:hypothetical protein
MSHNREITKFVAASIVELCQDKGIDMAKQFPTRKAFTDFVFGLSIKMVQQALECEFKVAYDVVMGDGQFDALAKSVYAALQPA